MPLRKSASLKENSDERTRRNRARAAAKKAGLKIEGKQVHHKDGNNLNNAPSNLSTVLRSEHGKQHGRGNGKRGKGSCK